MHEYSLVQALVEQVEERAAAHPGAEVRRVHVGIGDLAGVDPALFVTAFETFKPAGCCATASLAVRRVQARWACPRCGQLFTPGAVLRCGQCKLPARLEAGAELMLERIELEVPDRANPAPG